MNSLRKEYNATIMIKVCGKEIKVIKQKQENRNKIK